MDNNQLFRTFISVLFSGTVCTAAFADTSMEARIAQARSAAPAAVSNGATIVVDGETVVEGMGECAAGLMEAAAQIRVESHPVLLVAYDHTAPVSLASCVGDFPPFAVALALGPAATEGSAALTIETVSGEPVASMDDGELEGLRVGNPAGAALPLLGALARGGSERVILPHVNGLQLAVNVETG